MTSLNLDKIGRQLAKIQSKDSLNNKIISVNADEDAQDLISKEFSKITLKNGNIQPICDVNFRQVAYIQGASGSGKSTWIFRFCSELKKRKKDTQFFLISSLDEDSSLDKLEGLMRVKVDEENFVNNPIDLSEFPKGSVLIFDDIDVIGGNNKKLKNGVYDLLNRCLEIGRHNFLHCLISNHLPTNGIFTKRALNESSLLVWFPHSGSSHGLKYLLQNYCGLSKEDINWCKNQKSRWCCLFKHYPQVICSEKEIKLLSEN